MWISHSNVALRRPSGECRSGFWDKRDKFDCEKVVARAFQLVNSECPALSGRTCIYHVSRKDVPIQCCIRDSAGKNCGSLRSTTCQRLTFGLLNRPICPCHVDFLPAANYRQNLETLVFV